MPRFYPDSKRLTTRRAHWLVLVVLLLAYGLMVSSAVRKSPTVDEQSKLFRGVAYVRQNATHFLLGHPLLDSSLAALPLLTEPDLRLPLDEPSWEAGNWSLAGDAFLWRLNDNPQRIILLGRLPVMWLALLLAALAARWGRQWGGPAAGVTAAVLLALDPNLLAHARLVTGDVALTFFFTLAVYGYWRYAVVSAAAGAEKRPYRPWLPLLAAGVGLGAAGAVKFNAALLLPILGLLGAALAWRRRSWRPLVALLLVGAAGSLLIWAVYRFALRPLPGGAFWEDLFWVLDYFGGEHGAYLFGRSSPSGWWYYFPAAFVLKTPLPTLILFGVAAVVAVRGGRRGGRRGAAAGDTLFLLLPPLLYLGASMLSSLNIGYRHLLPMLPFLVVWAAGSVWRAGGSVQRAAGGGLALATALATVLAWPDYIPFFNSMAGGPQQSWRLLSDSNVDWGQDLPALAAWQQENGGRRVKLSYFGTAHPSAYGVEFQPLPTWAPGPEQGDPVTQPYHPADPAPGLYAISVTNLHGVVLGRDRDLYAVFREQTPLARLGGSIFVYEVAATGPPVDVVFAGLRPMDLEGGLHGRFGSNDVRPRWIEAQSSFLWPAQGGWLAAGAPPAAEMRAFWPDTAAARANGQALYQLPPPPALDWPGPQTALNGQMTFLGYRALPAAAGELALLTAWRVEQRVERPLQIFVHALDADDQIVGQWDGLRSTSDFWAAGDVYVQFHRFAVADAAAVTAVAAGMYDGETLERLGERIRLSDFPNP